jgi:broad specificity phosphatase PhoE
MAVERVYLIRHGQTAWNAEGRWQGFTPTTLSDEGFAQVRALARSWKRPLNAIYSSDLPRAFQTAEALGDVLGIVPIIDERLRESNLGIFQGLTNDEIRVRYPLEYENHRSASMNYTIPNGESRLQLQARTYAAFCEICEREIGPEVAIVSHGGPIKVLLYKLFGHTPELQAVRIVNTSVTTLERRGNGWHLAEIAATPHLDSIAPDRNTL